MAHHKYANTYPKVLHSRYNWNLTVTVSNPEQEAALPFEYKTADIEDEVPIPAMLTGVFAVGGTVTATLPAGIIGTIEFIRTTKTTPPVKSPIEFASANNVNSLTYVVQQADAGTTLGVETSNTTTAPLGYDIPGGPGPDPEPGVGGNFILQRASNGSAIFA